MHELQTIIIFVVYSNALYAKTIISVSAVTECIMAYMLLLIQVSYNM